MILHGKELPGLQWDDVGPRLVSIVHEPATRLHAIVVVDTHGMGLSGGGVRLSANVTIGEVARLARAMTYKYALLSLPIGGAKAGIALDPNDPERAGVIQAFLRSIKPLIQSGTFLPGPDMGTNASDFADVIDAPVDERMSGAGVVAAAAALFEHEGSCLDGARVAIEGFGKLGRAAASRFLEKGARIVAVSTLHGMLHDPEGLDMDALFAVEQVHGDHFVEHVPGVRREACEALFEVPCDVLIPGARPDAIHLGNARKIRARMIVPGANIPYAQGTLEIVHARGVKALPDFVSNAGGVLACVHALAGLDHAASLAAVESTIHANVERVLQRARSFGERLDEAGIALARTTLGLHDGMRFGDANRPTVHP